MTDPDWYDHAKTFRDLRDQHGDGHPLVELARALRTDEVLAQDEAAGLHGLWYLSFVDSDIAATIPEDEQVPGGPSWLGACVVEGTGVVGAAMTAHEQGCNPGGQVNGWGPWPIGSIPPEWCNRLLSQDEAQNLPEPA